MENSIVLFILNELLCLHIQKGNIIISEKQVVMQNHGILHFRARESENKMKILDERRVFKMKHVRT